MLIARNQAGELVNALVEPIDRLSGDHYCPACQKEVLLKKGLLVRPHFAHMRRQACDFYPEHEGEEHLTLKAALYDWASQTETVEIEAFIPEVNQVADLLINGRIAIEIQCSRLSFERLCERTHAYQKHGYQVIWLCGKSLWLDREKPLSLLQKNLMYFSQQSGFFFWELDQERQLLRQQYLIHESIRQTVHYQTACYPFGKGDFLSVLRRPYRQALLSHYPVYTDPEICQYVAKKLYHRSQSWMALQEEHYQRGDNLLTKSADYFFPQVRPVKAPVFAQITTDVMPYYRQFDEFYAKQADKTHQILYNPNFYDKMKRKDIS